MRRTGQRRLVSVPPPRRKPRTPTRASSPRTWRRRRDVARFRCGPLRPSCHPPPPPPPAEGPPCENCGAVATVRACLDGTPLAVLLCGACAGDTPPGWTLHRAGE